MLQTNNLSIPRNWLVFEANLNGSALDTNDGTKVILTATNITYGTTDVGYQKQCSSYNWTSSYISAWTWFDSLSTGTICAWIKTTKTTQQYIMTKGNNSWATDNFFFGTGVVTSWRLGFYNWWWKEWNTNVADNKWHFVVLTGTTNSWVFYVDWVQDWSFAFNPFYHTWWGWTVYIWARNVPNYPYYLWNIQWVRLYDRILSTQEIQTLYLDGQRQLGVGSYLWSQWLLRGAVAYYDMKGDANDVIGGNNWTVTGATLTTDRFGISKGYNFSWATQDIICPNSSVIGAFSSDFTVWCFINADTLSDLDSLWGISYNTHPWVTIYYSNWLSKFRVDTSNSWWTQVFINFNTSISTWAWYHILYTRVWTTWTIYINWTFDNSATVSSDSYNKTSPFVIARRHSADWGSWYFDWKIDDVIIWNRWLSAWEVKALYDITKQKYLIS